MGVDCWMFVCLFFRFEDEYSNIFRHLFYAYQIALSIYALFFYLRFSSPAQTLSIKTVAFASRSLPVLIRK